MGFGGSGGGSNSVSGATDVALNNPTGSEVLTYDSSSSKWKNSNTAQTIVRWNSSTDQWAPRPANAPFGVLFISTNDVSATAPSDANLQAGDVWRRHPDAV